jgi:hypothetical protein
MLYTCQQLQILQRCETLRLYLTNLAESEIMHRAGSRDCMAQLLLVIPHRVKHMVQYRHHSFIPELVLFYCVIVFMFYGNFSSILGLLFRFVLKV